MQSISSEIPVLYPVSQVDVEEWIDAGKGIVVAHTIADGV